MAWQLNDTLRDATMITAIAASARTLVYIFLYALMGANSQE